jgi:hypothetical protein
MVLLFFSESIDALTSSDLPARDLAFKELSSPACDSVVLTMCLANLMELASKVIPPGQLPGPDILDICGASIKADLLRACILIYFRLLGKIIPHDFQLEAVAMSLSG